MCEHVREHVCWARGGCGCVCLDEGRQQWEFTWHEEELSPHFTEIGCHMSLSSDQAQTVFVPG